jgi:8-oxo-dGTP pyrophosphatase MutT (NUDIX family)
MRLPDAARGRDQAQAAGLAAFRRLPLSLRRMFVRLATPNYTLGVVVVWLDADGRVLLVMSRHQRGWALPGGLARRGEEPDIALRREVREELAIDPGDRLDPLAGPPIVDAESQILTVVYVLAPPSDGGAEPLVPRPDGVEVTDAAWFAPTELPHALVRGTAEAVAAVLAAHDR